MTISETGLRIEAVPLLRRIMPRVVLDRAEVLAVWRSTGLMTPGVGVREPNGVHFFWTWRGRRIVALLDGLGYQLRSRIVRDSSHFWAGHAGQSSSAHVSGVTVLLISDFVLVHQTLARSNKGL
jgi:hypothetical protein